MSIAKASREARVDHATGLGWATEAGFKTHRRPKKITATTREKIVFRLKKGKSKKALAVHHSISQVSVSRILRSTPGLMQEWQAARMSRRRSLERRRWKRLVASHGHLGNKILRQMAPASYAWLYRNDRAWFDEIRSTVGRIVREPRSRVDWKTRDELLAKAVESAAAKIVFNEPKTRITFGMLCTHIDELKPRLSQTKKLPLTKRALKQALRRGRATKHGESLPFG